MKLSKKELKCPFCDKILQDKAGSLSKHCLTNTKSGHGYGEITDLLQKMLISRIEKNIIADRIRILRGLLHDYPEKPNQRWSIENDVLPILDSMMDL